MRRILSILRTFAKSRVADFLDKALVLELSLFSVATYKLDHT